MGIDYLTRTLKLILGLFLYALGSYLSIQANIGLSPWDAFSMGLSHITRISYGNIVVITGAAIIVIDLSLKEKIGFGTILNCILIGKFVDMLQWIGAVPILHNFWVGIVVLLLGQVSISIGSYFYINSALGCGPRDSLMVSFGKRMPNAPIGLIRGIIEGSVLLIGWLLGAKVGVGTVISVFGISFILQYTFKFLSLNVKTLEHENIADTVKRIKSAHEQKVET